MQVENQISSQETSKGYPSREQNLQPYKVAFFSNSNGSQREAVSEKQEEVCQSKLVRLLASTAKAFNQFDQQSLNIELQKAKITRDAAKVTQLRLSTEADKFKATVAKRVIEAEAQCWSSLGKT